MSVRVMAEGIRSQGSPHGPLRVMAEATQLAVVVVVAAHRPDELDPDAPPVDLPLLAGLFGRSAWLGVRRPLER
ncbi:hypothetical protein A4R44_07845 [Amycolatopsis sp. M39]|uniref:Uncharacterized protein n=2 Tax=Amycolatopsis rubida TaxID=112413 RepID=A0A1I5RQJ3_9PSEU|nr:hypothetical protein A4R44_07845 [Amycolatopsis sp. M39]SFP60521.1 hypothetical protein SAMN05421854_10629 [Amycolatopsis rubida]